MALSWACKLLLGVLGVAALASAVEGSCCLPGEACWPSEAEFDSLSLALDPAAERTLWWAGDGQPRVCSVPAASEDEQPLFGAGRHMLPLYVRARNFSSCLGAGKTFCDVSVRNAPYEDSASAAYPLVTVWPLTAGHVSLALRFAAEHSMCVCVAGTAHDFMNRHSCNGTGMFIRTALLKDMTVDAEARTAKLGAGLTFSEIHEAVAGVGFVVSSGWASTVGIAGWTLGSGHGPFAPAFGLGSDNVVEMEVVLASGDVVTVNGHEHADLYWAMRGGGGSAWGVVTSFTVRMHPIPSGGFTEGTAIWTGRMCGDGLQRVRTLLEGHLAWSLTLSSKFGGLAWIWRETPKLGDCDSWVFFVNYVYLGAKDEVEWERAWTQEVSHAKPILFQDVKSYDTWWQRMQFQPLEPIRAYGWLNPEPDYVGGVPSVAVSREHVANGSAADVMERFMHTGESWGRYELYQDITGNIGSPQDPNTAVNAGMREGIIHFVFGGGGSTRAAQFYELGHHSYFGESAYEMSSWQQRYWGDNYERLLAVKAKYDPNRMFFCRHCVGSETQLS